MNLPFLVLPYKCAPRGSMTVSRLTQTLRVVLASAISEADGALLVEAAGFGEEVVCPAASTEPALHNISHVSTTARALRINPALPDGDRHPVNRQHISRYAIVHMVGLGEPDY